VPQRRGRVCITKAASLFSSELVELREYEKILVGNLSNGERFETYLIYGESQKSLIELNGATAHLGTALRS